MSYSNVETTMQTIIQGVPGLELSTTLGDESVLDKGVTKAAVIEPGALAVAPLLGLRSDQSWTCKVTFYVRYTTKSATHSAFVALRDAIIQALASLYPDIANAAVNNPYLLWVEGITAESDPQDVVMRNSPETGPVFRAQTLSIAVKQTAYI